MKYAISFTLALWGGAALAAPVDVLSYLQAQHSFTIANGASPPELRISNSGPTRERLVNSGIDDPNATLAIDDEQATVGCLAGTCDPSIPYTNEAQHRTNRPDPTEFADAQFDISLSGAQDPNANNLAIIEEAWAREGLAQARITSDPAGAFAESARAESRMTYFENVSDEAISFSIGGEISANLLARVNGDDGLARTSTVIDLLFENAADLSFILIGGYTPDIDETGAGANIVESLFLNESGVSGLRLIGSASAQGDGGFTEATLDASIRYLLTVTLGPGETATMTSGFTQRNYVEYEPTLSAVPLPAALPLMAGALALLGFAGRGRQRP